MGKSAILRALRWVMLGEWDGKAGEQILWGAKDCNVAIVVDGKEVVRGRDGEGNFYEIDGDVLEAFRTSIPPPVSKLFRVGPDNFQGQHDAAFWMSLGGGQAASALNGLFHLEEIDAVLDSVGSSLRQAKAEVKVCEQRLDKAQQELTKFGWAIPAQDELLELEHLEGLSDGLAGQIETLELLIEREEEIEKLEEQANDRFEMGNCLIGMAGKSQQLKDLIVVLDRVITLEERECHLEKQRKSLADRLAQSLSQTCPLCGRAPSV